MEGRGLSLERFARAAALAAMMVAVGASLTPAAAQAQTTTAAPPLKATPKGTIGLGMIGAEVGFAVPALAGLKDWYWYAIFPSVGAAAGAVGGYFAFDHPHREKWSVAMLVTGMALVVPTMVLTVAKTAYNPESEPSTLPADTSPQTSAAAERLLRAERLSRAGPGLVRHSQDGWLLTAPGISVVASNLGREVQVPLLTGVF